MQLPACLQRVFDVVVRPLFVEGESFPERLRKIALLVFAAMSITAFPALPVVFTVPHVDPYDHGWIAFRYMIVVIALHTAIQFGLFNYTYMRVTKTCPLWLADLSAIGATVIMAEFSLANPHSDCRSVLIIISMMAAMLATPRLPLIVAFQFLVYYFCYFRDYWQDEFTFLTFPFDHPHGTLFEKCLQLVAFSVAPVIWGGTGIHIVVRGYIRQNEEQRLARKMTLAVAKSLTVYDIDGVEATLKENEGLVDGELLESFNDIKENLKAFRPHIPQYLIEAAIERSQRKSTDGNDDESEGDVVSSHRGSEREGPMSEGRARSRRHSRELSKTSATSSQGSAQEKHCAVKVHHHAIASKDAYFGQITSAFIDLGVKNILNGFVQMTAAVDAINDAASATRTSVHSIQGDTIFASWNATSRVANHAVHACGFAAKMREALATFSALHVSCSIVQTACHTVFAGTKQSHLLLIGEGIKQHEEQRRLGRELSTFVANESVVSNAETWGMFLGFTANNDGSVVYDLVGPHAKQDDEEWMYQLESAKNPWEVVTTGLKTVLEGGSKASALESLNQSLTAEQLERPSVVYFRNKNVP